MSDVRISGDTVTISHVVVSNRNLADLLKGVDQEEQVSLVQELLVFAASAVTKAETDAELRELQTAAELVKEGLTETGKKSVESIQAMFAEQLKVDNPASFYNLIKQRLSQTIVDDLALTNPDSPLAPIFQQLKEVLELRGENAGEKSAYAKSREKGTDFEDSVHILIQGEAAVHGDTAEFTGNTPTESGDKTGDSVVTFNNDLTNGSVVNVVWESKTDKTFKSANGRIKRDKATIELNTAMQNRKAICGIFVTDSRGIDLDSQPEWEEFDGNKLSIVIDQDNPDLRLVRMAYLWSRAYYAKTKSPVEREFDVEAIEREFKNLERVRSSISQIKSANTAIKTGLESSGTWLGTLETAFNESVASLGGLLGVKDDTK